MEGEAADVAECLDVCPLHAAVCAQVCSRAAAVGARQRGLPFYVPFRQAPLEDWATLFPGSPAGSNWQASDAPTAAFAPWIKASVPWQPQWNLAAPPLSATMADESKARCHQACEARSARIAQSSAHGLGPLPGVYTGWGQAPWTQLYEPPLLDPEIEDIARQAAFDQYLQDAMSPAAALDARAEPWELNPVGASSFRAEHIAINGQPVAFQQALPVAFAADLRG